MMIASRLSFFLFLFCLIDAPLKAQSPTYYTNVSQMPMFPGGIDSFHSYVKHHLIFPAEAIKAGTEGTVYLSTVIDTFGKPTELKCVKGLSKFCDSAAINLFKGMPFWSPGKHQGNKVAVLMNIPIEFKLDLYYNRFVSNGMLIYRDPKVIPVWFHKLPFDKWIKNRFTFFRDSVKASLPVQFELNIKIDTTGKVIDVLYTKSIPSDYAQVRPIYEWLVRTLKNESSKSWRAAQLEGEKVNATFFAVIRFE